MADGDVPQKPPRPSRGPKKHSTNDKMSKSSAEEIISLVSKSIKPPEEEIQELSISSDSNITTVPQSEYTDNLSLQERIIKKSNLPLFPEIRQERSAISASQGCLQSELCAAPTVKSPARRSAATSFCDESEFLQKPTIKPKPQFGSSSPNVQGGQKDMSGALQTNDIISDTPQKVNDDSAACAADDVFGKEANDCLDSSSERLVTSENNFSFDLTDDRKFEEQSKPIPLYAVIDRTKKRTNVKSDSSHLSATFPSQSSPQRSLSDSLGPPKKPPRTFAHSEYMRLKDLKLETSTLSRVAIIPESVPVARRTRRVSFNDDYEEISSESDAQQECIVGNGSNCSTAEEKAETLKRRSTSDKLPAPPRPPPPTNPDIRNDTLPSSKLESTSTFARNLLRASERSYFGDKRKSADSENLGKVPGNASKPAVVRHQVHSVAECKGENVRETDRKKVSRHSSTLGGRSFNVDMDALDGYAALDDFRRISAVSVAALKISSIFQAVSQKFRP